MDSGLVSYMAIVQYAAHPRHNAVVVVASSVLEHYIWIVVDDKVTKSAVRTANAAFGWTAGTQCVLRDIRHVLLEDKWRHFVSSSALT